MPEVFCSSTITLHKQHRCSGTAQHKQIVVLRWGRINLPLDKNTQLPLLWLLTAISISVLSQTAFCKQRGCAINPQEKLLHLYHTDLFDSGSSNIFVNSQFSSCILRYSTALLPAYLSGTAKHLLPKEDLVVLLSSGASTKFC